MPIVSMFYGIIIYLYAYDNKEHHTPHLHIEYQDFEAVIAIEDGKIIAGEFPGNKLKLVEAWLEIHRDELIADWNIAAKGEQIFKIEPLR